MHRQALLCFLLLITLVAAGQELTGEAPRALRAQLNTAKADSTRIGLLIQLSQVSLNTHKADSALYYAQRAQRLSTIVPSNKGYEDATYFICKALLVKENLPAASAVLEATKGPFRIRLLILFGEHYLFKPGELSVNLDKAGSYLHQAQALSASLGSVPWMKESLCALAKYSFARGNLGAGKQYFMRIIKICQRTNDRKNEARWWTELGNYLPVTDSTYADGIASYERGLLLYRQLHDKKNELETQEDLANKYYKYGRLATAEKAFLQVLAKKKTLKIRKTYPILYHLSSINRSSGKLNSALWYGLECVKNMELLGDKIEAMLMYSNLADVYRELGQTERSLAWYRLALQQQSGRTDFYYHYVGTATVHSLIKLNKSAQALHFLEAFVKQHPPVRLNDREIIEAALGDCYTAIGQYSRAEQHYLSMIKLDALEQRNKIKEIRTGYSITGSQAYALIAQFYTDRLRFKKARYYALKALAFNQNSLPISRRRDLENILFRVELASGNTPAATRHFEQFEALNDSIFSIAKSRQIEELQIQYETAKKEQDLALLRSEGLLQRQKLRQSIQVRNFSYAGIGLLVLGLGLGYNRFRLKQRSNQLLEARQEEINHKNAALQTMVLEKEWLLKEIHHRVKNNLQVVVSLLNSQASRLSNNTALTAIQESQHRVQAMALIHQKLYQSEQVARIAMPDYLKELVTYLRESYDLPQPVTIELDVAPIEVDVTLAVPLGLIINEAITNALKYAFPQGREGRIRLSLQCLLAATYQLTIEDNGVGLPPDYAPEHSRSLGMTLIHGFSRQLGGKLTLRNDHGLKIVLMFSEPQLKPALIRTDYAYQ